MVDGKFFYPMVEAIHRVILNETPDQKSLDHWSSVLVDNTANIDKLITLLLQSKQFETRLPIFLSNVMKDVPFCMEVTQNGELFKLLSFSLSDSIKNKIVVDVGANGKRGSNSYDLMARFGWRGLLIEANPHLADGIRDSFAGLDFSLVSTAVSNYNGKTSFFISTYDENSSLSEDHAAQVGVAESVEIPVRRLPDILREYSIPRDFGLLSIDAEGQDLNILNDTIEDGYRPQWIIFEDNLPQRRLSIDELEVSAAVKENYDMRGATYSNMFLNLKAGAR